MSGGEAVGAVVAAARALVKANGCLAAGAHRISPKSNPPCSCTYCRLKSSLEELDAVLLVEAVKP